VKSGGRDSWKLRLLGSSLVCGALYCQRSLPGLGIPYRMHHSITVTVTVNLKKADKKTVFDMSIRSGHYLG